MKVGDAYTPVDGAEEDAAVWRGWSEARAHRRGLQARQAQHGVGEERLPSRPAVSDATFGGSPDLVRGGARKDASLGVGACHGDVQR